MERLREKLSTFIGHDGANGEMDQGSVREARLLAQRMGVPMYMRVAGGGGGDADQNLDELRREIRRLKVVQATELREMGKLRQMAKTQQHLLRHTSLAGGAEGQRELARMQRVHKNQVSALQRRISQVENKNLRLEQLLAHTRLDKLGSPSKPSDPAPAELAFARTASAQVGHGQTGGGRGVVSVCVEGLVLNKDFADFARNEPTTLLVGVSRCRAVCVLSRCDAVLLLRTWCAPRWCECHASRNSCCNVPCCDDVLLSRFCHLSLLVALVGMCRWL